MNIYKIFGKKLQTSRIMTTFAQKMGVQPTVSANEKT